jgi:hypothetical protein
MVGRLWCPKLIPDIEKFLPVAIFKMATTIQHCSISTSLIDSQHRKISTGLHFQNGKFLAVAIFKMATTIPQKFNIVRFQRWILRCQ